MNRPNRSTAVVLPRPLLDAAVVADGLLAGAIAAGVFALYFLVVDVLGAEALATPSLVGAVLLDGASPSAAVPVSLGLVGAFSLVHAAAFGAFGVATSALTSRLRTLPDLPLLALGCFFGLEGGFLAATALVAPGLGTAIGHGAVVGGNALAAVAIALYLRNARG